MTACVIGTILKIEKSEIIVEDFISKEQIRVTPNDNQILDFSVGQHGIFIGYYDSSIFRATKIESRKFLDPLYEEDVLESSSSITFVTPIDNPFNVKFTELELKDKEEAKTKEFNS